MGDIMVWFHAEKSTTLARSLSSGLLYTSRTPRFVKQGDKGWFEGGMLQRVLSDIEGNVFIIPGMG